MIDYTALKQERGRWLATVASPVLRRKFGADVLPVMRRFENDHQWAWSPKMIRFFADDKTRPDLWWIQARHDEWRRLLLSGTPLYVRMAIEGETEGSSGSVGRPIGVFTVGDLILSENQLSFTLPERFQ